MSDEARQAWAAASERIAAEFDAEQTAAVPDADPHHAWDEEIHRWMTDGGR